MRRGEVFWYSFAAPDKRRPVVILTRDSAIPVLNSVTVAPVTSTVRGIPTEVELDQDDGMPTACAANLDNIQTVPKRNLGGRITRLSPAKLADVAVAISFALGIEEP